MTENEEYWADRFITLNEELHKDTVEKYLQIEYVFQQAQWEIKNDIEKWYNRIANNNNLSLKEANVLLNDNQLTEFHWNLQEYIKYGMDNVTSQSWNKQLENASAKYHITRLEALKMSTQNALEKAFGNQLDVTDTMARDTFTSGSYKTMYELQKGLNIGFDVAKINEGKLEKIISKPWVADGRNFSSRIWGDKAKMITELHSEITKLCITGKSNTKAINHMMNYVNTSINNAKFCAKRLIVTEKAFFASLARFETFENLNVKQYKISAIFDLKTSQICRDMDGEVFDIDEYAIGKTAPPFHPFCRTDTVPYINNKYTENDMKKARDENGEIQKIPANMTYREWEKTFLKDTVDDVGEEIKDTVQLSLNSSINNAKFEVVVDEVAEEIAETVKSSSKTVKKELTSDNSSDIIKSNLEVTIDKIKESKNDLKLTGELSLNPKPIDLSDFKFDDNHINSERDHNVTREEAVSFMENALYTLTKWKGTFVNFISLEGAVYIDVVKKIIRTAYTKNQFDEITQKFIEELSDVSIQCPLVNEKISAIDCIENIDIANRLIKETALPKRFKVDNWRAICLACPNSEYDENNNPFDKP